MQKTKTRKAPWRKANPRKRAGTSTKLSPTQKATARRNAAKAGRPYPNLVDNMRVAAEGKRETPARSRSGKSKARSSRAK